MCKKKMGFDKTRKKLARDAVSPRLLVMEVESGVDRGCDCDIRVTCLVCPTYEIYINWFQGKINYFLFFYY